MENWEPVTMTRLEQPKRKQKQEGLGDLRSVQGNTTGPGPGPSFDKCEELVRSSRMHTPASLSRLGREDGERVEHRHWTDAQSASAPDAAPAVRRIVSSSRRESTPGKAVAEVAAATEGR